VALAIIGAFAIANVVWTLQTWPMGDFGTYWTAAERIRDGGPLYVGDDPLHSYRYAPWFAWLWVPLTALPREVVAVGWEVMLLAATAAAVLPLLNRYGWPLAALLGPLLFAVTAGGNVQALMVCALLYGIDRRSGPLWIALAASLKATPLLLVGVHVARREWGRVVLTLALTAALVAPMAFYDLAPLTGRVAGVEPGLLAISPVAFAAVGIATAAVVAAFAMRRSNWTMLAALAGSVVTLPRLFAYDVTILLAVRSTSTDRKSPTGA
jgi:hypothetical protein